MSLAEEYDNSFVRNQVRNAAAKLQEAILNTRKHRLSEDLTPATSRGTPSNQEKEIDPLFSDEESVGNNEAEVNQESESYSTSSCSDIEEQLPLLRENRVNRNHTQPELRKMCALIEKYSTKPAPPEAPEIEASPAKADITSYARIRRKSLNVLQEKIELEIPEPEIYERTKADVKKIMLQLLSRLADLSLLQDDAVTIAKLQRSSKMPISRLALLFDEYVEKAYETMNKKLESRIPIQRLEESENLIREDFRGHYERYLQQHDAEMKIKLEKAYENGVNACALEQQDEINEMKKRFKKEQCEMQARLASMTQENGKLQEQLQALRKMKTTNEDFEQSLHDRSITLTTAENKFTQQRAAFEGEMLIEKRINAEVREEQQRKKILSDIAYDARETVLTRRQAKLSKHEKHLEGVEQQLLEIRTKLKNEQEHLQTVVECALSATQDHNENELFLLLNSLCITQTALKSLQLQYARKEEELLEAASHQKSASVEADASWETRRQELEAELLDARNVVNQLTRVVLEREKNVRRDEEKHKAQAKKHKAKIKKIYDNLKQEKQNLEQQKLMLQEQLLKALTLPSKKSSDIEEHPNQLVSMPQASTNSLEPHCVLESTLETLCSSEPSQKLVGSTSSVNKNRRSTRKKSPDWS